MAATLGLDPSAERRVGSSPTRGTKHKIKQTSQSALFISERIL
jgi:hypothetical protein